METEISSPKRYLGGGDGLAGERFCEVKADLLTG
jgi:hypothetical protein